MSEKKARPSIEKLLDAMTQEAFGVTSNTVGRPSVPLNLDVLMGTKRRLDNHVLVVESQYIPDDCLGIIILRPEDCIELRRARTEPKEEV